MNSTEIIALNDWVNQSLCDCCDSRCLPSDEQHSSDDVEKRDDHELNLGAVLCRGKLFEWLMHAFKPDLLLASYLPSEETPLSRLNLTFKIAQEEFSIQKLLTANDLIGDISSGGDHHPSEFLSVLTYLMQMHFALKTLETVCSNHQSTTGKPCKIMPKISEDDLKLLPASASPRCHDCHETVFVLERFILVEDQSPVCHRRCFRCARCRKLLRIGLYRTTKLGNECLEHEREDLISRSSAIRLSLDASGLYPKLPERKPDDDVANIYPKLKDQIETQEHSAIASSVPASSPTPTPVMEQQKISVPSPSRDRSAERETPIPSPRPSLHSRTGSDVTEDAKLEQKPKPQRPERPAPPSKAKKPNANTSVVSNEPLYPEDLNPFGEEELEIPRKENQSEKPALLQHQPSYDNNLNPFGANEESDDDSGSLSSNNPFNESDEEHEKQETGASMELSSASKKQPPPRPPPPAVARNAAAPPANQTRNTKKRPAPPPPSVNTESLSAVEKKMTRKKRPAPPRPLPLKRQIRSNNSLTAEQILINFDENDANLLKLETESRDVETEIRENASSHNDINDETLVRWSELVRKKIDFVRKETELVYMYRERQLDELHAEIEYQLRCLIEKPESEKTADDFEQEAALLQRMLDVIEEKSKLDDGQTDVSFLDDSSSSGRNSLLRDSTLGADNSKSSTLEKTSENKQSKSKKKIKSRLKKLKQKLATEQNQQYV